MREMSRSFKRITHISINPGTLCRSSEVFRSPESWLYKPLLADVLVRHPKQPQGLRQKEGQSYRCSLVEYRLYSISWNCRAKMKNCHHSRFCWSWQWTATLSHFVDTVAVAGRTSSENNQKLHLLTSWVPCCSPILYHPCRHYFRLPTTRTQPIVDREATTPTRPSAPPSRLHLSNYTDHHGGSSVEKTAFVLNERPFWNGFTPMGHALWPDVLCRAVNWFPTMPPVEKNQNWCQVKNVTAHDVESFDNASCNHLWIFAKSWHGPVGTPISELVCAWFFTKEGSFTSQWVSKRRIMSTA